MDGLLIRHEILTEIKKQVFDAGKTKDFITDINIVDTSINPALYKLGISDEQISKWIAWLVIEEYIKLRSKDEQKRPMYITMTGKGLAAVASEYFNEQYKLNQREYWKFGVQIFQQLAVGITASIALLVSCGQCKKETINKASILRSYKTHTAAGKKTFSSHHTYV
jgi:DNA-directed RNA polymerase